MGQQLWRQRFMKVGIFSACLIPLAMLAWDTITDHLGPNPIEAITRQTGTWTLRFLLISLAVTPGRRLSGWNSMIRFRRMLGLFAFFYAGLHFLTYIWLDQFFVVEDIAKDVIERPFITVGFLGFAILIPLAVTSTAKMIKRLGGKRWQLLHRLVYASAVAGVLHYLWLVKADVRLPLIYGSLLAVLLGYRLWGICAQYMKPRQVLSRQPIMRA